MVLFPLDDISIPWRDNLKLTLQRPARHPANPVMKAGPINGPDGYGTLLYGTVIKQEGKFRMWYIASPRADSRVPGDVARIESYRPVAYAESADGIHWAKPDLGLVEFRGSRHNNLVQIEPETDPYARSHDFVAVLFDRDEPEADRRYKMAYITEDQRHRYASPATTVSPDGIHWRLVRNESFTHGSLENTSLIKFGGLYYLAGQVGPPMRRRLARRLAGRAGDEGFLFPRFPTLVGRPRPGFLSLGFRSGGKEQGPGGAYGRRALESGECDLGLLWTLARGHHRRQGGDSGGAPQGTEDRLGAGCEQ